MLKDEEERGAIMEKSLDLFKTQMSYGVNSMILKCVDSLTVKYGLKRVIEFCLGITTTVFIRNGDVENRFFGALEFVDKKTLKRLIGELIDNGLITKITEQTSGITYPYYVVSDLGRRYLAEDFGLTIYKHHQNISHELFTEVRQQVWRIIKKIDNYAYCVTNKAIEEICRRMPSTDQDYLDIDGIGQYFIEHFYPSVKRIVDAHRNPS